MITININAFIEYHLDATDDIDREWLHGILIAFQDNISDQLVGMTDDLERRKGEAGSYAEVQSIHAKINAVEEILTALNESRKRSNPDTLDG